MTADQLANLMVQKGYKVRKEGDGYRTSCPAHGGTDANMTIRPHAEGGAITTCHSHHCLRPDIAKGLGLTMDDLTPAKANGNGGEAHGQRIYPYRDEAGTVLFEVVREVDKRFWQRLPGAKRGGIGDARRVLFGLPELLTTSPGELICIAEGEKCVVEVAKLGIRATTNPHGAGKWRPEYTEWLKQRLADRKFLVLPDNDLEGKKHAVHVCDSLQAAGLAVFLADLGPLPEKGDVVQWISAGGTAEKLRAMAAPKTLAERRESAGVEIIRDIELAAMVIPEHPFVIEDMLPIGYTLLASKPKVGKTRGVTGLAVAVAHGGKAMGQIDVQKGEVLFLALESDLSDLQSRLSDIRNGDPPNGNLYVVTDWPKSNAGGLDLLEEWLAEHPLASMVIIDTIGRLKAPTPRNSDIYQVDYDFGTELKKLASRHAVGLLGCHHQRKAAGEDTFDTMSGTLGVTAACDALWVLQRTRGQADAVLSLTGRKIREQEMALRQDEHIGTWSYMGNADEFRKSKERAEIVRLLRESEAPLSPTEIAEGIQKRPDSTRGLLRKMVQAKEIYRTDKGGYAVWDGMETGT